jgi:FkbM family methyltransferase
LYQYDSVKRIKSALRPLKHILFGREGIYAVVERAKALSGQRGREIATVFDVGAAVGDTTELFLKEFPRAEIYCFEPLPDSFSRLQKRVGKQGRVHLFNFGLDNTSGEAKFYVAPYRDSSSMIPPVNIGDLAEKIKYYLARDDEREKIAAAAFRRTVSEHTYEKRFEDIFAALDLQQP